MKNLFVYFVVTSFVIASLTGCSSFKGFKRGSRSGVVAENKISLAFMSAEDLSGSNSSDLAGLFEGKISSEIMKSGNFTLVEREMLEKVLAEQTMRASGVTSEGGEGDLGNLNSAQYYLKLAINNFNEISEKQNMGISVKFKQVLELEVSISIVSTRSGSIIFNKLYQSNISRKGNKFLGIGDGMDLNFKKKYTPMAFEEVANKFVVDAEVLAVLSTGK